jgi:hypothetical protein
MLRIDPMAVLSSPLSGPLWPRCAVAPVPGTAFAPMPPVDMDGLVTGMCRRQAGLIKWGVLSGQRARLQ